MRLAREFADDTIHLMLWLVKGPCYLKNCNFTPPLKRQMIGPRMSPNKRVWKSRLEASKENKLG